MTEPQMGYGHTKPQMQPAQAYLLHIDGHRRVMSFLAVLEAAGVLDNAMKNPAFLGMVATELKRDRPAGDEPNGPEINATASNQLYVYRVTRRTTSLLDMLDPNILGPDALALLDAPAAAQRVVAGMGLPPGGNSTLSDAFAAYGVGTAASAKPAEPIHEEPVPGEPEPAPRETRDFSGESYRLSFEPAREAPALYRRRSFDVPTIEPITGFLLTYDDGTVEIVAHGQDGGPFFHRIEPIEVA